MKAWVFQHFEFEGAAAIGDWFQENGHEVAVCRLFAGDALPDATDIDFLVLMGGPMSVNDEAEHSWLAPEKEFLRAFIASGKPVLGVCLGAQLMASALGARVYPNGEKEIGWFPVEACGPGDGRDFAFPVRAEVFHWHGETFDLPSGARLLARSAATANQAFLVGARAIGLQFHLEVTEGAVKDMVASFGNELRPAAFVQGAEEILRAGTSRYMAAHELLGKLLLWMTRS